MKFGYVVIRKFSTGYYEHDMKVDSIHATRKDALTRKRLLVKKNASKTMATYHIRKGKLN